MKKPNPELKAVAELQALTEAPVKLVDVAHYRLTNTEHGYRFELGLKFRPYYKMLNCSFEPDLAKALAEAKLTLKNSEFYKPKKALDSATKPVV